MSSGYTSAKPESDDLASPLSEETLQQEKLSVIGHMASSVAHDLSNPLATIAASAQAILAFWPRSPKGESSNDGPLGDMSFVETGPVTQLREDLELILAEAKRAGQIVNNLLAFARSEEPSWEPVSVAKVVRQVAAVSRHHLIQHNVALHTNVSESDTNSTNAGWILGVESHLQQVLMNLIINAQQAIHAYQGHGTIRINMDAGPERVLVTVSDDGPGVPPDLHRTIFKAFYTTKRAGEGTGLGLSIAAGIIAGHGGELSVTDLESGGAAFSISLPTTNAPVGTPGNAKERPSFTDQSNLPSTRGSVLLVDDEDGIRRSVGRFLRRYGCEVEAVATGADAIAALANKEFDVVISDIRMPGLNGQELYRVLEKGHPHMTSRIVFMSGDLMRPETRDFLEQCGCPSLQKPYELVDLVRILEELWEKRDHATPHSAV